VSYAPTVGINKDGEDLFLVDEKTGTRTDVIDDRLLEDVDSLSTGVVTDTGRWVDLDTFGDRLMAVPAYFDARPLTDFDNLMKRPEMAGFESMTIEQLVKKGWVETHAGHGSPSADLRRGEIPYIKVSDIRAGQVNINPTNRVSDVVARRFWKGEESGLRAWDLITPTRTSKNIGEFAVLMPGQERMVLTKEVLILRATDDAPFDNFYLLWAMTLKAVRRQWERIVFMQTNREDVGTRYREIIIPTPPSAADASRCATPFRAFYEGMDKLRDDLVTYLESDDKHHLFISTVGVVPDDGDEDD
jgi:type I restriction enzyme M protein